METGLTLAELIESVQLEIGHSTDPRVGLNYRDTLAARVRREYRRLHAEFDWPHLLGWHTAATVVGQSLYSLPANVELAQVVRLYHKLDDGDWALVERGLRVDDYNEIDTDAAETRDPILKWRPVGAQIEVWPAPATTGSLRFLAKSKRVVLQEDDDVCDLDGELLALYAAASELFKAGRDEAGLVLNRATKRFDVLRQRLQVGSRKVSLV